MKRNLDAIAKDRRDNWKPWRDKFLRALMEDWVKDTKEHAIRWAIEYYAITMDDIRNGEPS